MVIAVVVAVVLASCAETRSGIGGSGPAVPYGANADDYRSALADTEPVTIYVQATNPAGSLNISDLEMYMKTVTEWSGEKITFDVAYSNAIAKAEDADDALEDGRIDMALVIPGYEPSEFPVSNAMAKATLFADQSPIEGTLSATSWMTEFAFSSPELTEEFEEKRLKILNPANFVGGPLMFCPQSRTDLSAFKGTTVSSGSTEHSAQVSALGASPVSIPYSDVYEGVQRGVVDCVVTAATGAIATNVVDVAPQVTFSPDLPATSNPAVWAFSADTWNSLPLAAQQLLWDKLSVLYAVQLEKSMKLYAEVSQQIAEAGGSVKPYTPGARRSIEQASTALLAEFAESDAVPDPSTFLAGARAAAEKWKPIPAESGYRNEADLAGFSEWFTTADLDFTEYADRVHRDVYLPHRPS
ncbi:TRAP-type C4-dicarboxylate transport system periplasmic component [Gordonia sp. KTR9]|nr:TRAP-type C4-dicarboxylate transport system periplasmic component [Gordonia sp. KTR9]